MPQLEQTGTTISQTFSGLLLDKKRLKAVIPAVPPAPTSRSIHNLSSLLSRSLAVLPLAGIPISRDNKSDNDASDVQNSIQYLLLVFLFLNGIQLLGTIGLWRLDVSRRRNDTSGSTGEYQPLAGAEGDAGEPGRESDDEDEDEHQPARGSPGRHVPLRRMSLHSDSPLLPQRDTPPPPLPSTSSVRSDSPAPLPLPSSPRTPPSRKREMSPQLAPPTPSTSALPPDSLSLMTTHAERRRGNVFAMIAAGVVLFCWAAFLGTVFVDLGRERNGSGNRKHGSGT